MHFYIYNVDANTEPNRFQEATNDEENIAAELLTSLEKL